jgi:hypothetical protein
MPMPPTTGSYPLLFEKSSGVNENIVSVSLFHDESNDPFHAHGCLVVPTNSTAPLLRELARARVQWSCDTKLHFTELTGQKIVKEDNCASHWTTIGVEALRRRAAKPPFTSPLFCKLGVILFDKKCTVELRKFSGPSRERKLRWNETLLRILLTSIVSYCYEKDQTVRIEGVFTDGNPYHREISEFRILERLKERLGPVVEIAPKAAIHHVLSDHRDDRCDNKDAAQLLQLTDLLLGGVVSYASQIHAAGSKKFRVRQAVSDMLQKEERGAGFKNSGHYRSFSTFKAKIEKGQFEFNSIPIQALKPTADQIKLEL